ncbi:uncharacterized protein TNCV_513401 [Trichonephila clavipes]|nr:uncharacterized protein TNCV_513401 [Trichonephila clavipes]
MGDFMCAENADMHYICGHANGNGSATLRRYHARFPDQQMPDHRIFQRLHRQLRETRSFHLTRHDAGRRRAVRSTRLEENISRVVVDKPESNTRYKICCSSHKCKSSDPL